MTKTIFITGAASGIGAATARKFASEGWFVGLADVDRAGLQAMADELGAQSSLAIPLDVTDRAQWDSAVAQFAAASGGRMDLFFNNAGIGEGGMFDEVTEDAAARVMAINFEGVVHGIYACLPMLKDTAARFGRARIVNTGSASGIMGAPRLAVYSATKFAVRGLTDALSIEFALYNIDVAQLQPWFLDTKILDNVIPGSNRPGKEVLLERNVKVLPASLAADTVWDIATVAKPKVHYPVGGPAKRAYWMARFFPDTMRNQIRKRFVAGNGL